jgi:hypothetical protein
VQQIGQPYAGFYYQQRKQPGQERINNEIKYRELLPGIKGPLVGVYQEKDQIAKQTKDRIAIKS